MLGWHDPAMPGRLREGKSFEFRLKLSDAPATPWRTAYGEHDRNQQPSEIIEKNMLLVICELSEIESAIERIRRRLEITNLAMARIEDEQTERAAQHRRTEEENQQRVLAAVSKIRFDDVR